MNDVYFKFVMENIFIIRKKGFFYILMELDLYMLHFINDIVIFTV